MTILPTQGLAAGSVAADAQGMKGSRGRARALGPTLGAPDDLTVNVVSPR